MIVEFDDQELEALYVLPIKDLGKLRFPKDVIVRYRKKIDSLRFAADLETIKQFKGNNLEKLKGREYKDCFSIRVNDQYRIIFTRGSEGIISVLIL